MTVTDLVESDRHVLGLVLVDKEQAPEQDPLRIERGLVGQ